MQIAIYHYVPINNSCPSCNMASKKTLIINAARCKEKIYELYPGQEHEFYNYIDYNSDERVEDGVRKRVHLEDIIQAADNGKVDVMIVIKLSDIDQDIQFVLHYYKRLKEKHVKLVTVCDGENVMQVLDEAIDRNL